MKQFMKLFKKVNGKNILKQYWYAGVLPFSLILTLILGVSKKSLEIVRLATTNRIINKLRKKYKREILQFKNEYNLNSKRKSSNKVWFCWWQGLENAPKLVKICYQSLIKNLNDREIILITKDNYQNYIKFPDYIITKIESGIITTTHLTDLLRLELLIKYGGTWIDSTVLCTGNKYPDYLFDSELFVFQNLKPGLDGHPTRISSWFITSCTNHPILILTRHLLYKYWKKNKHMINYFIFHMFFELAIEAYPKEWNKVVPFSNSTPHILLLRLFEKHNEHMWKSIKEQTCFHKLSYKFSSNDFDKKGTYYKELIENKFKTIEK